MPRRYRAASSRGRRSPSGSSRPSTANARSSPGKWKWRSTSTKPKPRYSRQRPGLAFVGLRGGQQRDRPVRHRQQRPQLPRADAVALGVRTDVQLDDLEAVRHPGSAAGVVEAGAHLVVPPLPGAGRVAVPEPGEPAVGGQRGDGPETGAADVRGDVPAPGLQQLRAVAHRFAVHGHHVVEPADQVVRLPGHEPHCDDRLLRVSLRSGRPESTAPDSTGRIPPSPARNGRRRCHAPRTGRTAPPRTTGRPGCGR